MNTPKNNKKKIKRNVTSKRVMIVDDDPDHRLIIQKILEPEGYITMQVENGSSLLQQIDSFNPHIIILDVLMPGLSTKQILEKLQEKHTLKIILLTVVRFPKETLDEILKLGKIVAYIKKPFDIDTLLNIIRKIQ